MERSVQEHSLRCIARNLQGDHEPGKEVGDIVIQLEEKEHSTFQRHGRDLTMRMDVDVSEVTVEYFVCLGVKNDSSSLQALCGLRRPVKTLDNRQILITSKPGEVIKQADIKMVKGEGMPTHKVVLHALIY